MGLQGKAAFLRGAFGDRVGGMKPFWVVGWVALSVLTARGESYAEELKRKGASESPDEVEKFIEASREANKDDPAYYVASANYWWGLANEPFMSTKPAVAGDFVIADLPTPRRGRRWAASAPRGGPARSSRRRGSSC